MGGIGLNESLLSADRKTVPTDVVVMGISTQPSRQDGARISRPALGAVISAAVAVLIAALLHANSVTIGRFLDDSTQLAQSEGVLVSTQLSLRTLSQAVVLEEDVELGVADRATAAAAREEANRVLDDLKQRLDELGVDPGESGAIENATATLSALENGNVVAAGDRLSGATLDSFQFLHDSVEVLRDEAVDTLNDAKSWTQRVGTIAGFLIVLLAPALAIYAYWRIARRQLDSARGEMDSRLKAERRVLQAKDEFISSISHELRTPLTSIYGFSEVLIDQGLVDPDEAHTLISVINEESAQLNRMVEDLLTIARDDTGDIVYNIAEFDVTAELETVAMPLQRSGTDIEIACPPTMVRADQLRVRQVLRNLLSNVHKWGGEDVFVTCHSSEGIAVITVADNGSGVPPELERRLFSRYMHEGDEALTTGTIGLGLAVVKILVDGMDGDIRYERDEGWTRFVVSLPLAGGYEAAELAREEHPIGAV
jgi:signal transduction histidine kinase